MGLTKRELKNMYIIDLDADHPGFRDLEYRQRRDFIALESKKYNGTPESIPIISYLKKEHSIWRYVSEQLEDLNPRYACERHIHGMELLGISKEFIPQLKDITEIMITKTGFQMASVEGLVDTRGFLESFSKGIFYSTQYIRHHTQPGFTPEPDIVHDILGHAGGLCDKEITDIVRLIGQETQKTTTPEQMKALERIYWYTIEYGMCKEDGKIKTFGAGNLSSFIDIKRSVEAVNTHKPFDVEVVANTDYDPTVTQTTLFVIDSFKDCFNQIKQYCDRNIK